MPETRLEAILRQVFESEGAVDPAGLARRAARDFEQAERDRRIYELRAVLTDVEIGQRFNLSARQVQRIIKAQMELRRVIA